MIIFYDSSSFVITASSVRGNQFAGFQSKTFFVTLKLRKLLGLECPAGAVRMAIKLATDNIVLISKYLHSHWKTTKRNESFSYVLFFSLFGDLIFCTAISTYYSSHFALILLHKVCFALKFIYAFVFLSISFLHKSTGQEHVLWTNAN